MATQAIQNDAAAQIDRMVEGTFVLNLSIGSVRTRAKVKKERVDKMAEALREVAPDTVEDMTRDDSDDIHVSKELLNVPEIADLISELGSTRTLMRENAQPMRRSGRVEKGRRTVRLLRAGLYLYSAMRVDWAEDQLTRAQARINALLDALEPRWEAIIEEDRVRLEPRGLFDARDYPTLASIREAATIRYTWLRFDVPVALKTINAKVWEAERRKARDLWAEMFDTIRLGYATTLEDSVTKLKASLVPGEDGKTRVLRQGTLDKFTEWLASFRVQDVTGFEDLAVLVDKAKATMRGVDAEVLRTEDRTASRVAATMDEIGEALAPLVLEQTRRVVLRD